MSHDFDKTYWETHWADGHEVRPALPAHPALQEEIAGLPAGTALDAGAGEGAEASWLADKGWQVTAVDISATALARAARLPRQEGVGSLAWVEADLADWEPAQQFDLVATFYAHPAMPQHSFYERIARWVAPGGTLLIVGHHDDHGHAHGETHPSTAVTRPDQIRALFDSAEWVVHVAEVRARTVAGGGGHGVQLRDVIARLERI